MTLPIEAIWGADPLEYHGGFHSLHINTSDTYISPLAVGAELAWTSFPASIKQTSTGVNIDWTIDFPDIDWNFLQQVYGWTIVQYQAWIRGIVINRSSHEQLTALTLNQVLEYWVNNDHYFGGDFLGLERAPQLVRLQPGENVIEIRLIRDVRSMGGIGHTHINPSLKIAPAHEGLSIVENSLVAPEIFDGRLASPYVGVTLHNTHDVAVEITQCTHSNESDEVELLQELPLKFAANQARPLSLQIKNMNAVNTTGHQPLFVNLCFRLSGHESHSVQSKVSFVVVFKQQAPNGVHKFTFLHPSGVVSYAVIRPPNIVNTTREQTPLMVNLHGAGVDANGAMVRHSLDEIHDLQALTIFPSGMGLWSSDDWHTWGLADALAAVEALRPWQQNVHWSGPSLNTDRFLVAGHSNGGQGTWYFASHFPDRTLAAAPASGYTSIKNYVPFSLWTIAEQSTVLESSRKSFRNELFMKNLEYVPILHQHGSLDDNVPAYHSRLMKMLRYQNGLASDYAEIPGKPHWWTGAMTTASLQHFYHEQLARDPKAVDIPRRFEYIVSTSDDFGPRFGVVIDQLRSADRLGRISVRLDENDPCMWHIRTSNIHRFHIEDDFILRNVPSQVLIDLERNAHPVKGSSFILSPLGTWLIDPTEWRSLSTRHGRQRGAMEAVMRSRDAFQIIDYSQNNTKLAVQIGHNMLQYFGAASDILDRADYDRATAGLGNMITLAVGSQTPKAQLIQYPIELTTDGIILKTKDLPQRLVRYEAGLGAIMLRPLPRERIELLAWGYDSEGLNQAIRLIPTLTGPGQPDFAILRKESKWTGHAGAIAMGYYDHDWSISGGSFT